MAKAFFFIATLAALTFGAILLTDRFGDAAANDCNFTALADVGYCR